MMKARKIGQALFVSVRRKKTKDHMKKIKWDNEEVFLSEDLK